MHFRLGPMLSNAMLPRAAQRVHQMAVPSRWGVGGGQVSAAPCFLDVKEHGVLLFKEINGRPLRNQNHQFIINI